MDAITMASWLGVVAISWDDRIRGKTTASPATLILGQLALGVIFYFGQAIFGGFMSALAVLVLVGSLLGAVPVLTGKAS